MITINKIVHASSFHESADASAMIFSQPASWVAATFITSASALAFATCTFALAFDLATRPSTKVLAKLAIGPKNPSISVAPYSRSWKLFGGFHHI